MLVGALPHNRLDLPCHLVHDAEPRQLKPPRLYGNATRFTVEFLAISYPNDERVDAAQHRMNTIEMPDVGFGAFLLGDVLHRAEPSHSAFRIGVAKNRLDRLSNLNPCLIGAVEAIFEIGARSRRTCFKRFGPKDYTT